MTSYNIIIVREEIRFAYVYFWNYYDFAVVKSIMRGEVVGMTPRRSRSSTVLMHPLVMVSTPSQQLYYIFTRTILILLYTKTKQKNKKSKFPY